MARDRFRNLWLPLMLGGLLILVFLMTQLSQPGMEAEPFANRSVFNNDATGYRAWFLASRKTGLPVRIWQKPFSKISELPGPATMLIVEPYTVSSTTTTFTHKDSRTLLAWVGRGNTLVLLDDFQRRGSEALLHQLEPSLKVQTAKNPPKNIGLSQSLAILQSYIAAPLRTSSMRRLAFTETSSQARVLLADEAHRPLLVQVPYQAGTIIMGTPVDLGSNTYLHGAQTDNYQFLSNLLVVESKPIFVNEFVHGYTEISDVFAYLQQKTPLGRIFMQLVLGFLVILWLSFVRWTPKLAETPGVQEPGPSGSLEAYTHSLANIYHRTHAATAALEPQVLRIETILNKRYRVTLKEEARVRHLLDKLSGGYSSRDESPAALWESLQKAHGAVDRQERIPHRELLKLSRQLSIIQDRLERKAHQHGTRPHRR
jgi:hypothetical protein